MPQVVGGTGRIDSGIVTCMQHLVDLSEFHDGEQVL